MTVSVIICTRNPHPGRLARTLAGLRAQTLAAAQWECLLVDNASTPALTSEALGLPNLRLIREPQPGLSYARRRGLRETSATLCVFADDDNVLAPDYLAHAVRLAAAYPRIGAFGGRSLPEFETPPGEWMGEFFDLLALRDLGSEPLITLTETPPHTYPCHAPIGAGMVLRREAAQAWLNTPDRGLTDRRGNELTSGGDNDIVLTLFAAGWDIAYFPELVLTHLIPSARLNPDYLARLNRGIQKSWVQVLALHGICPWPRIPAWTISLRYARIAWRNRNRPNPVRRIALAGLLGRLEGQAALVPR